MRRELPMLVAGLSGLIVLLGFFFEKLLPFVFSWSKELTAWGTIVSAFAMGLAAANLIVIHSKRLTLKNPNWYNSAALLLTMVLMVYAGVFAGQKSYIWDVLFGNLMAPLGNAMFSLLIFFIASASFRAFRARNVEATILLLAGVLVLLGRAPVGELISGFFPR
ncbi:MAG: hypothetical protein M1299_04075, partial [Firmicutes bacterium]|nr:hypothetical protein [Bacillota bacterium]